MSTREEIIATHPLAWGSLNSAELDGLWRHGCASESSTPKPVRDAIVCAVSEIRRHREMIRRLEVWAAEFDADTHANRGTGVGPFIAAELRSRMKGPDAPLERDLTLFLTAFLGGAS